MTKQDVIEYLLDLKHDVQAKSPMDIALDTAIEVLKQPTIEPEVRYGRWIEEPYKRYPAYSIMKCSECGWFIHNSKLRISDNFKFCPACGARMDGDENAAD